MIATITNLTVGEQVVKVFVNFEGVEKILTFDLTVQKDDIIKKIQSILSDIQADANKESDLQKSLVNMEITLDTKIGS